jgi:hypothetical protein
MRDMFDISIRNLKYEIIFAPLLQRKDLLL